MANIVEIHNVSKTFGSVRAVEDVSLEIEEGEFMTILGPSGCGKTTTLRMIGGFEYPDRGRVLLGGEDVTDLPPYKRPVNMMFQDFALFPHMTVAQNIGYGLHIAGLSKSDTAKQVDEALRTIELSHKAASRPAELSIGQKQRVALARALVRRPQVLLLDEPMSALDAQLREAMQVELKHLHEQIGLTFIMVTHDQTEALVMSDRVTVMDQGEIVQIGTPTELYDHPASPYVANFLGTSNILVATVREIISGTIVTDYGPNMIRAAATGKTPAVGARVMLSIRPEKLRLLAQDAIVPEDVNRLEGVISEQFFHGDSVRLSLDIGGDTPLVIHHQLSSSQGQGELPPAGQTVNIAVDPSSVTLFEDIADHEPEYRA
ncbi:MAG: ABC transporter ATP-binding protein [Alphaproteobacteria bacterium]|jgi:spermidine/putrescine ABC transporter ATP-binding subunit|nr:ABC transporter ATP-binding protein [Alphaproteobacteria bacterium]